MSWRSQLTPSPRMPFRAIHRRWILRFTMALAALLLLSCSPASREARLLKRGKSYLEKKDYARAVLEFRSAEQAMPQDVEPYYHEGLAYVGLGNYQAAFRAFNHATQIDPKHLGALVKLTELLSMSKKEEFLHQAEQRGKTALALSPGNPDALNALAFTALRLGNEADASLYLRQALDKFPQNLRSSMALAVVRLSHKDMAGAEQILKTAVSRAPQSPEPLIALGQLYLTIGKPGNAETVLRQALNLDPRHAQALLYLAGIEAAAGRKDQAEELYRRMAALPDKQFRSVHAVFLMQTGKTDAGLAELLKLYNQDPGDRNARTRLVAAYIRFNRLPEARKLLDAVLNDNAQDAEGLLQKAEMEVAEGKLSDAQNDLNEVLHYRADSAEAHFLMSRIHLARGNLLNRRQELAEALRLNPNLTQVRIELARCLTLAQTPGGALTVLDQASDEQKTTLPMVTERNWALLALQHYGELRKGIDSGLAIGRTRDLLMQDASLKIASHNPAGARSLLEEILKRTPEDLPALELLSQTYTDQKRPKVGLEQIRYYAVQRPKSAPLQFLLGRVLLAQGKLDAARAAFITAKAADPKYTQADLILAQLDHAAGRDEAARRTLNALFASKDTDRDTTLAAHLLLGALETAAGNHAAELEHWRKVLDVDRNNVVALNNMAYVLLNYANQPDEALKYAQQAHELALDNPDIEDTVGWALYQKGIYGTAVQHLEHAVAHDGKGTGPNHTVRKYHLAMAYFKHGDRKRGLDVLEAALKTDPNIPEAQMAESLLSAGK